jgi:hypothetical protein
MRDQRRSACTAAGAGSRMRPKGVAFAFSANRSQRSPKVRRSAASSGELANFARRAHSAAWARQYITYDDITRSHTTHTDSGAAASPSANALRAAHAAWASIPPARCTNKGITWPRQIPWRTVA